MWVSGVTGTVSTANPNIPSQTTSVSFGDILSHLNSVPIMGAAEVRYGRLGLLTDLIVTSLRTDLPARGGPFSGATVRLTELLATVMPTYRVLDLPGQALDLGVGVRPVAYWTKLSFNSGALPGFSRSFSLSWADPLLGARYHLNLTKTWGLTAYGDVGGFGAGSDLTWQLLGTVDYRYNEWLTFRLGYRHLQINYKGNALRSDTALSGPILGSTVRF